MSIGLYKDGTYMCALYIICINYRSINTGSQVKTVKTYLRYFYYGMTDIHKLYMHKNNYVS